MHPIDRIKSFARLDTATESRLRALMTETHMSRGETINGSTATNYAYYIVAGAARIFYTQRGIEHTVNFIFDDQYLVVPAALLATHGDTLTVEFLEPSTIIVTPEALVRDELESSQSISHIEALLFMNTALLEHTQFVEEFLSVALTCNARDRYLWAVKKFPRLTKCATLTQIASYLGMTKETLYRLRAALEKNNTRQ